MRDFHLHSRLRNPDAVVTLLTGALLAASNNGVHAVLVHPKAHEDSILIGLDHQTWLKIVAAASSFTARAFTGTTI